MPDAFDRAKPVFSIGVVSELTGLSPKILRTFEQRGLLSAHRRNNAAHRLYSVQDIEVLRYARYLHHVRGVNVQGIQYILEVLARLSPEQRGALVQEAEQVMGSGSPVNESVPSAK